MIAPANTRYDEQRQQLANQGRAFFPVEMLPPSGPAAFRSAAYAWGRREGKHVRVFGHVNGTGWVAVVMGDAR